MKFLIQFSLFLSCIFCIQSAEAQQNGAAKKYSPLPKNKSNSPTTPNAGSIYRYANTNIYKPYHLTVDLSYLIMTSHDTTVSGPEKDYSHSFGTSDYNCQVNAYCDTVFVQVRNAGGDIHYDCNWDVYDEGKPKDKRLKVRGNVNYISNDIIDAYSDFVLYNNQKKHDVAEKWSLHSLSFDQNPMFNFKYDIEEGESKGKGDLSFMFKVDKAQGTGTKTENGDQQDMIGNPDLANQGLTKTAYIAGLLQSGLNNNSLQGDLSNKGDGQYNIEGVARMSVSDASIEQVKTGFIIRKDTTVYFRDGNFNKTVSYHFQAKLDERSNYEAIIEPDSPALYDVWIPKGMSINPDSIAMAKANKEDLVGNALLFNIVVRDKETKKPIATPWKANITLGKISHNKGWCMNYPPADEADAKADLRFDQHVPKSMFTKLNDSEFTTTSTPNEKGILVNSYDYASYGTIAAKVTLADGTELEAHSDKDPGKTAWRIPKDDNNNDIADQWEIDKKIKDNNYSPGWDEDKCDGNCHSGDGFTLFEEYRGFVIMDDKKNRVFSRLQPDKRKLFVYLKSGTENLTLQGIKMFEQAASDIKIYRVYKEDDMAFIPEEKITEEVLKGSAKLKHWVDFNKTEDKKYFCKQKVCAITFIEMPKAFADSNSGTFAKTVFCDDNITNKKPYDEMLMTPTDVYAIWVRYREADANYDKEVFPPAQSDAETRKRYLEELDTAWNYGNDLINSKFGFRVDLATVNDVRSKILSVIAESIYIFTVAHEMGHAVGIQHHAFDEWRLHQPLTKNEGIHMARFLDPRPYMGASDDGVYGNLSAVTGNNTCPMLYWSSPRYAHFKLLLFTGKWKVKGPVFRNAWEEPYRFCRDERDNCASRIMLKAKKKE